MKHLQRSAAYYFLSLVLLVSSQTAVASSGDGTTIQDRRGCGDYTILSDARDRAIFDRHCGTNNEKDFEILRDLADRLDPKREAHAAASRGDFRLAAVTVGGPPPTEMTRLWAPEGINCENLKDSDMVIFVRYSDVILGPTFGTFQNNMTVFAREYNKALIKERGFPVERVCSAPKAN